MIVYIIVIKSTSFLFVHGRDISTGWDACNCILLLLLHLIQRSTSYKERIYRKQFELRIIINHLGAQQTFRRIQKYPEHLKRIQWTPTNNLKPLNLFALSLSLLPSLSLFQQTWESTHNNYLYPHIRQPQDLRLNPPTNCYSANRNLQHHLLPSLDVLITCLLQRACSQFHKKCKQLIAENPRPLYK